MDVLALLASFTETATGGDEVKILSTGFGIRNGKTPTPPLETAVVGVIVKLNGAPGHSKLTWNPLTGAEGYLVQGSPEPITATSWTQSIVSTRTIFRANGAVAGQKYWYRVAGFNATGQSPWSMPSERPVM